MWTPAHLPRPRPPLRVGIRRLTTIFVTLSVFAATVIGSRRFAKGSLLLSQPRASGGTGKQTRTVQDLRYARDAIKEYEKKKQQKPEELYLKSHWLHDLKVARQAIHDYEEKHHAKGQSDELKNLRFAREAIKRYEESHFQRLLKESGADSVHPNEYAELQELRDAHQKIEEYEEAMKKEQLASTVEVAPDASKEKGEVNELDQNPK